MRVNRNYVLTEYVLNENDCIGITHLRASTNKKDQDKAKQKKVSASTNPTDRVLMRRPDTFF